MQLNTNWAKELELNNCLYPFKRSLTFYFFFCALMQGECSWCAKDAGIKRVGEASLVPALSILAEPCRSRVGTTGFSLKLSCPHSLKIPFLTYAGYRTVRLRHWDLLEETDASAVATFRLTHPRFALLVEKTGLVHIHRWNNFQRYIHRGKLWNVNEKF